MENWLDKLFVEEAKKALNRYSGGSGTGGGSGVSVQANWDQTNESSPDFIKNKPDEMDALEILMGIELVSPAAAEDGSVYTDENGFLYSL